MRYGFRQGVVCAYSLALKSAATALGPAAVVLNPGWVSPKAFGSCKVVEVDPAEPAAANVVFWWEVPAR